jgi:ribonuclease BN (tRNA processing enzyme)
MNISPIGTSSVVFVTLSGLFWGGWVVGSQTPEGQEALARAYEAYAQQKTQVANDDLFAPNALRALVCGTSGVGADGSGPRPCLAVAAAGRMFVIDAGSGAAAALNERHVPMARLEAVLLTGAGITQSADLDELYMGTQHGGGASLLPVYGPADTVRMVEGLNAAAGLDGANEGLQAWGPSPEPGRSVIVFEADGLTVSAFTTPEDAYAGRVGYRFDYRGRSLVVAGDGRAEWASADTSADVVLHSAQTTALAHLHQPDASVQTVSEVAAEARDHNATLVLTGAADDAFAAALQISEARAAGLRDVVAGRIGMLLELPLENADVNVRPL